MITTFESRCLLKNHFIVLRPISNTMYKGEIQVKIYMRDLHHEFVLFQQSRNFFRCVPYNEIEEDILGWNPSETSLKTSVWYHTVLLHLSRYKKSGHIILWFYFEQREFKNHLVLLFYRSQHTTL